MAAAMSAVLEGFGLGAGLIIAIGAQNAFVLRQGIGRDRVVAVVLTCIACDWGLIALGAAGLGALVEAFPQVTAVATWGGVAFLAAYGARAFIAALHPGSLADDRAAAAPAFPSTRAAVAATLAVSLLNPHVYLDTVVLLGSVASHYLGVLRFAFVAGAGVASVAWFASLGFGARLLAPLFRRPATWRLLDLGIGLIMWGIAAQLALGRLGG